MAHDADPFSDPIPQQVQNREFDLAFGKALRFLGYRARSRKEIRQYLEKKKVSNSVISRVLEKLTAYRYLDDHEFARSFVAMRKKNSPRSIFALGYELSQKGISDIITQQVLAGEDDGELAFLALSPKWRLWRHLDPEKRKKKALGVLRSRGFNYEHAISAYERINRDPE